MAFGKMGLSFEDYAAFTYYHYDLKCLGFEEKNLETWKQTRQLAFITFMGYADQKKVRGLTAEKWWPLEQKEIPKRKKSISTRKDFSQILDKYRNYGRRTA